MLLSWGWFAPVLTGGEVDLVNKYLPQSIRNSILSKSIGWILLEWYAIENLDSSLKNASYLNDFLHINQHLLVVSKM